MRKVRLQKNRIYRLIAIMNIDTLIFLKYILEAHSVETYSNEFLWFCMVLTAWQLLLMFMKVPCNAGGKARTLSCQACPSSVWVISLP